MTERRVGDNRTSPATLAVALLLGIQTIAVFSLVGIFRNLSAENNRMMQEHAQLKNGMYAVANRCYEITKAAR
jgi:hypothetical protein